MASAHHWNRQDKEHSRWDGSDLQYIWQCTNKYTPWERKKYLWIMLKQLSNAHWTEWDLHVRIYSILCRPFKILSWKLLGMPSWYSWDTFFGWPAHQQSLLPCIAWRSQWWAKCCTAVYETTSELGTLFYKGRTGSCLPMATAIERVHCATKKHSPKIPPMSKKVDIHAESNGVTVNSIGTDIHMYCKPERASYKLYSWSAVNLCTTYKTAIWAVVQWGGMFASCFKFVVASHVPYVHTYVCTYPLMFILLRTKLSQMAAGPWKTQTLHAAKLKCTQW